MCRSAFAKCYVECFSAKDNSRVEVLHRPELVVPSGKSNCKVIQRDSSKRVSLRDMVKCFSVEDNGPLEVPCRSQLAVTIIEMICKPNQAGWAKFQCLLIKDDRVVDAITSSSLLELGDERFCW